MASKNTKSASKGAHKTVAEAQATVKQARAKATKAQRKVVQLRKVERASDKAAKASSIRVGDNVRHVDDKSPLPGTVQSFSTRRGTSIAHVGDQEAVISWPTHKLVKFSTEELPFNKGDRVSHPKHGGGTVSYIGMQFGVPFMDVLSDKGGTLQVACKSWTKTPANETWAVGTKVEHPAHGVGFVCGHTQTDGVVEVNFDLASADGIYDARGIGVEGIEVHQDELKLVAEAKPHKPHTAKKFNFPKRKHAEKVAKAQDATLGTAQEQNAAYAKLARAFSMNDRVVELNGHKREGNVFTVAPKGSGHLTVLFDGDTAATTKHVADLKKVNMKGHKVFIGDRVALRLSGEFIGIVVSAHFTNGTAKVADRDGVQHEHKLSQLKLWVPPKAKDEMTKFENLPLLSGFEYKGNTHVKVGNTSAIVTPIDRETNGGASATIPMIRLAEFGCALLLTHTKVRLKKDTRVKPIVSVPFSA